MASRLNEHSDPSMDDQNAALNKCISIFKSAKTDNERFAALLLVTRMVHSNSIDSSQRRLLFDAIGFTFINRLLKTKAEGSLYQALAVAILACFATDEDLLFQPQMVAKIQMLNEIIANPLDDRSIVDDAYQILTHFSSSIEGCKVLVKKGTLLYLSDIIKGTINVDMAWKVLLNMASLVPLDIWSTHPKALIQLTSHSAEKLKTLQDSNKFIYCTNLLCLLSHADAQAFRVALKYLENESQWLFDLCAGLGDILQGKVTSSQRDPALVLISVVIDLLDNGIEWIFTCTAENSPTSQNKADIFVLMVTSVCIEIRMILDESTTEEMVQKSTLLTSCYNILESIIAYLITMIDAEDVTERAQQHLCKLPQGIVTKLYSQITEAMMSVLNFLQEEAVKYEEKVIVPHEEKDLMFASARAVCAWLAEESMALQKEVNKVLPFLVKLAKDTMSVDSKQHDTSVEKTEKSSTKTADDDGLPKQNGHMEVIRFMLPALCHLSSNEKSRKILTENATHDTLVKYYFVLWQRCVEDTSPTADSKIALVTLLGVLLNYAVTEQSLVKKESSFCELQKHIVVNLPKIDQSTENMDMQAHVAVLGLMLTRHQKENIDFSDSKLLSFFKSVVFFLREGSKLSCTASVACQTTWSSISELWFLGVQVLTQEFNEPGGLLAKELTPDVMLEMMNLSALQSPTLHTLDG